MSVQFWDDIFSSGQHHPYSRVEMPNLDDPVLNRALSYFGDIKGKIVLDLGFGRGASSLFLASHGANVVSIDSSQVAVDNFSDYCRLHSIENIETRCISAFEISKCKGVDFVFGSMILHHIEPFGKFAEQLRNVLAPGGRGFFWENSGRSALMMWFRENVVGKLWVPKCGDSEEYPLTVQEIDLLRGFFDVEIEYPELRYFSMIPAYLFGNRLREPFELLDRYFYRFPAFRKYSYRQYILLK